MTPAQRHAILAAQARAQAAAHEALTAAADSWAAALDAAGANDRLRALAARHATLASLGDTPALTIAETLIETWDGPLSELADTARALAGED